MNQYLLSTKEMSKRNFRVGQVLYGKITNDTYTNLDKLYFYDKYADPTKENPYGVINGTTKNARDYIVTELLKQKFKAGQRALFRVVSVNNDTIIVFDSIEPDKEEMSHAFSYNKIREYNGLYYIEQEAGLTIVGFSDNSNNITIPSIINNKMVIAIGNYNEFGMPIALIEHFNCQRNIEIEEGLKIIDDYAFKGQKIKDIKLPSTIQHIGRFSFSECTIGTIDLSNTKIDSIEEYCFSLSLIKKIILPNKMHAIKNRSFYSSNIEEIIMPNELVKIESNAFKNCFLFQEFEECNIEFVDIGNETIVDNEGITADCLKMKEFDELELKLIGYYIIKDIEEDKIAEVAYGSDYEEVEVEKSIYFLEGNDGKKYEAVLSKYEDQDFEDEELSYKNYVRSIKFDCYIVNKFKIDRHLEYFNESEFLSTFKCPKHDIFDKIKIRYNDIEKIAGLTINSEYKYLFDDLVLGNNHGQEMKPSKEFIYYLIEGITPEDEEEMNKLTKEEVRYKLFKGIKE